ncbi:hypothetical protein [Deinococcus cellulosilyticus]|nr:hypothetical protein [Deinococcus cellulosilyticus]
MYESLGAMSSSEIDARHIHAHLVRMHRHFMQTAIFFLFWITVSSSLHFSGHPSWVVINPAQDRLFIVLMMGAAVCTVGVFLQAHHFGNLKRKTQALLEKHHFEELVQDYRKYLPR